MAERVSILGQTPQGFALLSDVTTSLDEGYRPACVNRLVAALVRAARRAGEELVFEPSGEALWGRIRRQLQRLLTGLFQEGALRGATPAEAFEVRCDRSTMTQNDLDAGRMVVSVQIQTALPIERITVVLGLHEGGQVSVLSSESGEAVQP
jgi:phage tail sheath protein FI